MLGLLSQPKQQSADAAIFTLCDRISNSSLVEDRRAAVLTLRGLAHENRELVASTGLRGLLEVLIKDHEDPVAAKATLETFLVLLNTETRRKVRNKRYVSPLLQISSISALQIGNEIEENIASDISLWLTDELLQNEQALNCVLGLISSKHDPFTSVYALQLVSAMVTNRPSQTKEAMIVCGGVAPLVTALGSVQDMVRDEALLLLSALTSNHLDLQKLVAFEGGFDKVFEILNECGGAVFGGRTAEDCFVLLGNLIEFNNSNQKLFTQSGYVSQWCNVLTGIIDAQNEGAALREQAISNIESTLNIGQLLMIPGAQRTPENQIILNDAGALTLALQIAFGHSSQPPVRVSALMTVASMINSNETLQADLLSMDVPYYPLNNINMTSEPRTIPVAQALLNWAISLSSTHLFDLRVAALECLSSSFANNAIAKFAFIQDQISGYTQHLENGEDVNLISVVAEYSDETSLNPFRVWFACSIIMRLFVGSSESKDQLRKVKVGDESLGMEVHSLIQAIAGELQSALIQADPTVALGYLQLLTVWLYDDTEAVNELTGESSVLQALLAHKSPDPLVESLSVIVLGTAYSFCLKSSPIPRADLYNLLTKTLGSDQYLLLVRKFRQSAIFQNFDPSDMFGAPRNSNGNPAVYIDIPFVELMRESIGYISRAIHANPDIEPSSKVTLEMLDDVKNMLHKKSETLESVEKQLVEANTHIREVEKQLAESQKTAEDVGNTQKSYESQLEVLKSEIAELKPKLSETQQQLETVQRKFDSSNKDLNQSKQNMEEQQQKINTLKAAKEKAENGVNNMTREIFQLQRSKDTLEKEVSSLKSEDTKLQSEIKSLKAKLESSQTSEGTLKKSLQDSQKQASKDAESYAQLKSVNEKLVAKLKETAADLKEREREEDELKSLLAAAKVKAEDASNELVTFKNRESQARKEVELAKSKIDSLKKELKGSDTYASQISELNSTVTSLKSELARTKSTSAEEIDKLKKEHVKKTNEMQKEVEGLNKSSATLKDVNSRLLTQLSEFKKNQDKNSENNESDGLRKQLQEKQEALDELLVLLDDLTEKKIVYKQRLREKGDEVSDSEDENDDENDEDEN